MFKYLIVPVLSAIVGVSTMAPPAHAADPDIATQSRTVSYADLDLTHQAGVQTLKGRIHAAAKSVCGSSNEGLDTIGAYEACVKQAEGRAVADVDVPMLTAAYGGERSPIRLADSGGEG